tara:strand:+ start:3684 stop:4076 length:393 start_codon:yes stop_codon:yes gene_type:complete
LKGTPTKKVAGTIAECKVVQQLLEEGFGVSWALGENVAWDLIADWNGKVSRLQVKSTSVLSSRGNYRIILTHLQQRRRRYNSRDADAIVAVCPPGFYVIPIKKLKHVTLTFNTDGTGYYSASKDDWGALK